MRIFFQILLSFVLLTYVTEISLSRNQSQEESQPMTIVADSLSGSNNNGVALRHFYANVHFRQGDIDGFCDEAIQFLQSNRVNMFGHVEIRQNNMHMFSPKIDYDGVLKRAIAKENVVLLDSATRLDAKNGSYFLNSKIAKFRDSVSVESDSVIVLADFLEYHRLDGNSYASGSVILKSKYNNVVLRGDTLFHDNKGQYARVEGKAILNQIDTSDVQQKDSLITFDTLNVQSDIMEAYLNTSLEKYIFTNNVKISRKNISAIAEKAVFFKAEERIELYGNPIVWNDSTQLYGDTIIIEIPSNKLTKIYSNSNALAAMMDEKSPDKRINQISAKNIDIRFENNAIVGIVGGGSTKSLYFMVSDEGNDGASLSSSDSVKVVFNDGEAEDIIWLGGVNGDFIPNQLIQTNPKKIYLPNFRWSEMRPTKEDILIDDRLDQRKDVIKH